jgi:hypothetical protein
VRLALAVGLAALALSLGLVLSRSPQVLAGTNGVSDKLVATNLYSGEQLACQRRQTLPRGTDAIRVSLLANAGPTVAIRVLAGSRVLSEGERAAGWGTTESVTVPVRRVRQTIADASVCVELGAALGPVQVNGVLSPSATGRQTATPRLEYLRPGPSSWFSLIPSIARHMGIGRAPTGAWIAYLAIAVMIAAAAITTGLVLRPGVPRAAWACALVAVLSALSWSLIVPPFQAPDEPSHFAYTQLLAETGALPSSGDGIFSAEEEAALRGLHQLRVQWHPEVQTISTPAERRQLAEDLAQPLSRVGPGDAGDAASQPPGYYALATIPYHLGAGGTLLERLQLMRLLSVLMAGITALFVFLFVREALPSAPWAWTAGGLAAALTPLLGFTSGAVAPDSMLCAVSAAIFYCLARAFRRGLTRRLALALGALTALGLVTMLSFVGLAPGIALGLLAAGLLRRGGGGDSRGRVCRTLALTLALALSPVLAYAVGNLLAHRHTLGFVSSVAHQLGGQSATEALSYAWQLYLPRLPGMHDYFPGVSTIRQLWFARAVGDYGWFDTAMPVWVQNLALIPAGAIAILATRGAIAHRATLRARLPELLTYLALTIGLLALIGLYAYDGRELQGGGYFQPRYLLPLLPLAGLWLALAARGAGRRAGPAAGALIVVLFLAHDIFSQLQVAARFYG